jgi:hypothetical protein
MNLLKKQLLSKKIFIYLLFSMSTIMLYAQNVDLGAVKGKVKDKLKDKKYISVTGGINASTTYSKSTAGGGRDPLTYLLSANASVSLWGLVNIPLSFTLTNLGKTYGYQFPTLPTRLSLHPRYKWVTTHIGQFTSNHSPYGMNGVPMTGFGIDLTPKGRFKYSGYYGRLQRAVQYEPNSNRNTLPFYKRMGYGGKVSYESGKRKLATSIFYGKDELTSLLLKPDSLQIYPQQNIAISNELSFPLAKSLLFTVEYGISVLTRDVRAPKYNDSSSKNWLLQTLGGRQSSNIYHAIKSQINYTIGSTSIGAGYERIDPGYQTLGSAYSNNDLRNITVNFAQALFNSKVNLSGNIGQQRDDLDGTKSGNLVRTVMAYNININPSPRLTTTVTYSNFQTFTNVKPQFQYINQLTQFDNLDTLNFRQLSQSASANVNYILDTSKEKPKSFNLNFSLQDAYDQQAGKVTKGNSSQFYNFSGAYIRTNMKKGQTINAAINATYNTIGINKIITLGPTLTYNKQLFKNKVILGSSLSYNQNISNGTVQSRVSAVRMNTGYNLKKVHNFTLNAAFMMRNGGNQQSIHDFTTTLAYSYNFAYPKQKKD